MSLKFNLIKRLGILAPRVITPGPLTRKYDEKGYYVTMGIGPDLMEASKRAIKEMIEYLSEEYQMERWEAYVLSSIVVDLKISEVVDKPNWIVSAHLPQSIFHAHAFIHSR